MSEKKPVGIRRIVTGHDENGKAIIIADGPTPGVKTTPNRPGVIFHNMWTTTSAPARYDEPTEATSVDLPLPPPKNGTTFRLIEFPPESQVEQVDEETAKKAFQEYGADGALQHGDDDDSNAKNRHSFMHRTETVDYAICLSGEMTMLLDDSEVIMKPGDVMIQRGTNHAWANKGTEYCTMAFVLIDGDGKRGDE
ncbi:MAG: cupin domain-containing protein [Rhodospirillaceae bacterium]